MILAGLIYLFACIHVVLIIKEKEAINLRIGYKIRLWSSSFLNIIADFIAYVPDMNSP